MATGFIVHPYETMNKKYHASYGNHNKTVKSFSTLKQAKTYLATKGIKKANYDSPAGYKTVTTKVTTTKRRRSTRFNPFTFKGW